MKPPPLWSVVAQLAFMSLAYGQAKDLWIGKRVFTQQGAVLKVNDAVVDDQGRSKSLAIKGKDESEVSVYEVKHVNGEWLWIKDEKSSKAGWVQSKWVVPYEQAIDSYTARINERPSAHAYN